MCISIYAHTRIYTRTHVPLSRYGWDIIEMYFLLWLVPQSMKVIALDIEDYSFIHLKIDFLQAMFCFYS